MGKVITQPIKCMGIYLRKSRAEDGIKDLEKHKLHLVGICNDNGWDYELYEEIESSVTLERQELQRLRKDIELGKIDAVMVNAVDRLSRSDIQFLTIIQYYFINNGLVRLFVREQEHILTDTHTRAVLSIQATLSQAEYSFIVKRLQDGSLKSAEQKGIKNGSKVYGYRLDKELEKLVIIEEEGKVVREIIELLLIGDGYKTICDKLNLAGHKTRKGYEWKIYNIKSIINSPSTRGHLHIKWKDGTETFKENIHEALMDEAEYFKIQEILNHKKRNYKGTSTHTKHFLQGILKCPLCNIVMVIEASKGKNGEIKYYIRACRNQVNHKKCGNRGGNVTRTEQYIRSMVLDVLPQVNAEIEKLMKLDGIEIKKSYQLKVKQLQNALKKKEEKENNLTECLADKIIAPDSYKKAIDKLKEEKLQLHHQIQEAKTKLSNIDIETKLKNLENLKLSIEKYDELESDQKRQLIQMLFEKIEYENFQGTTKFELKGIPA